MNRLISIQLVLLLSLSVAHAALRVRTEHIPSEDASAAFAFRNLPAPVKNDAAESGEFRILSGERDPNGATPAVLRDGQLPSDEDAPSANFFFQARTPGGQLLLDLGRVVEIQQINSYSWHPSGRGPQVYQLHASASERPPEFKAADPIANGWETLAKVDTRPESGTAGGQHAISIDHPEAPVGKFRYLLFALERTDPEDPFSNTFYSEIDVLAVGSPGERIGSDRSEERIHFTAADGKYEFSIEISGAADLLPWIKEQLVPTIQEWYPKIVGMLPSEGYEAPRRVRIIFDPDMRGVANASGSRIRCAVPWFRRNLDGEAKGAVVHELVHVVQQYGLGRRNNPDATRTPGWIVEGIPDYIRWFLYEPESKGAEITERNFERARYDSNYRITGNFLNWVVQKHGQEIIRKLNAAAREGRYEQDLWVEYTGKSIDQLGEQWREEAKARLGL